MRAVATRFKDQIFRSRIEAYLYEYLILKYNPVTLEYEPKHFSNQHYVPDFIVSNDKCLFAVEVKPVPEKANWIKYTLWLLEFTNVDFFVLLTPHEITIKDRDGFSFTEPLDKLVYFQAYNNVKHELNNRDD